MVTIVFLAGLDSGGPMIEVLLQNSFYFGGSGLNRTKLTSGSGFWFGQAKRWSASAQAQRYVLF
ncbi:MAG TPA: hypothetical protein VL863_04430 [bacterium]|jgi:hypothetical protein|nr:hypothetical protein [bacterium]